MSQLPRLVSGVDRYKSPPQPAAASRSDARRGEGSPTSDLELVRRTRTNLFVVGDDVVVERLLTTLWLSLAPPIFVRQRGERLLLAPTSPPVGTVVVYDVDTLTRHEQRALHHWMAGNSRTRVVSTATKSLQPMLQAGAFDEELYYRLNVMTLDLTSPAGR